jgi:hypothetical protein
MLIPPCSIYDHIVVSVSVCDCSVVDVQMEMFCISKMKYFCIPKIFISDGQITEQPKNMSLLTSKCTTVKTN